MRASGPRGALPAPAVGYTVFLQPMPPAAIFTPGEPVSLKGNFSTDGSNADWAASHSYIFRDSTGSVFNPFHNYAPTPYVGLSPLPTLDATQLRSATHADPPTTPPRHLPLPPPLNAHT